MDAYAQLGRQDLVKVICDSKKFRRLAMLREGSFPSITDMRAIQRAFNGDPDPNAGEDAGTDDDWRSEMKHKYQDDAGLQVVLARHIIREQQTAQ